VAARIGVRGSVRYLSKNRGIVARFLRPRAFRPEALLERLGGTLTDPLARIEGMHVFTFNQVESAVAWRRRILEEHG
jgi:methylenetetrahydrofolate reductase (NADPH)